MHILYNTTGVNKIIIRVNEFYKAVFTIDDSEFCIISQLKEHVPFSFFVFILYINIFGENELDEPVVITFSTVVFFLVQKHIKQKYC